MSPTQQADGTYLRYQTTWGWREKDLYGGTRDYADTTGHTRLSEATAHREQLLRFRWADDEFKVHPWVGPIIEKEIRIADNGTKALGRQREIHATVRRDDPLTVAEDSRRQAQRAREELARRFAFPKDDL